MEERIRRKIAKAKAEESGGWIEPSHLVLFKLGG